MGQHAQHTSLDRHLTTQLTIDKQDRWARLKLQAR
jgi:hypothetical protein